MMATETSKGNSRVRLAKVTAGEERQFERRNIGTKRDRYLATDVLEKVRRDPGYAEKVNLIERALSSTKGWVLDIGANTCGESEYLVTRGYSIIATDINEIALTISKARCAKFNRASPAYLACDGHDLSLEDQSVSFVILNEALHHMEDPQRTMHSVARVLIPGGRVFLYEPYALNPYRRLSEIRDRLRGTIELSFSVTRLKKILEGAGLTPLSVQRHAATPSEWKMEVFSGVHRMARKAYSSVSKVLPRVFGNVMVIAQRPGEPSGESRKPFDCILRCPMTGSRLIRLADETGYLSLDRDFRGLYPIRDGVPVLVKENAKQVDTAAWQAWISRSEHSAMPSRNRGDRPT